jgi:hypothetical protein
VEQISKGFVPLMELVHAVGFNQLAEGLWRDVKGADGVLQSL